MKSLINYLISLAKNILNWFNELWEAVKGWCLDAIYNTFDGVLTFFQVLIDGIPVPASWSSGTSVWGQLGSDVIWFANALHLPLAIGIIVAAWGIRFLLNLIPAALTRV